MTSLLNAYDVVIIGGGFSGIACAYQLSKNWHNDSRKLSIALIEKNSTLGGLAYRTQHVEQVLNVKASFMSIDEACPEDFFLWLKRNDYDFSGDSFVSRELYGKYLSHIISEKCQNALINIINDEAIDLSSHSNEFLLTLKQGDDIKARAVVLALGNLSFEPSFINRKDESLKLTIPWANDAYQEIEKLDSIILLGTGLTAVDVVVTAEAKGFRGRYNLISRHGLLPRPHPEHVSPLLDESFKQFLDLVPKDEIGILKTFRIFRKAIKQNISWHTLVESLRGVTPTLWQNSSIGERRSFLRHLRPYWDVYRHRIPLDSWNLLNNLKKEGRLFITAAQIKEVKKTAGIFEVKIKPRKSLLEYSLESSRVFSCLGLSPNIKATRSPLLVKLLEKDLVDCDELLLGLKTNLSGKIKSRDGKSDKPLYILGSLRKGENFESVAVRELRAQAKEIVGDLINNI